MSRISGYEDSLNAASLSLRTAPTLKLPWEKSGLMSSIFCSGDVWAEQLLAIETTAIIIDCFWVNRASYLNFLALRGQARNTVEDR